MSQLSQTPNCHSPIPSIASPHSLPMLGKFEQYIDFFSVFGLNLNALDWSTFNNLVIFIGLLITAEPYF